MRTRHTVAFAAATLAVVFTAGCGSTASSNQSARTATTAADQPSGTPSGTASSAAPSAAGEVNVTMWHSASGAQATALNNLIGQFNTANTGKIHVSASFQGSYADAQVKYTAAVQSGSTPSIMMMNDVSTQFMIDSKQVAPLYTFTKNDKTFSTDTIPAPISSYYSTADGLLSMPFASSEPVLYINPDLAKAAGLDPSKPPTSWSDVVAWAKQIKAKTSAYGFAMTMTDSWMLEELSASAGVDFCTPDNGQGSSRATGIMLTDPAQTAFLKDLQGLYTSGVGLNAATSSGMNNAFESGKLAMMLSSSGAYGSVKAASKFTIVVAGFPKVSQAPDAGVVFGGASLWIDGPGHSAAEQNAAYQVVKFLQSADSQALWSKATGYLAVNTKTMSTPTGQSLLSDPAFATMYAQLAHNPVSTATAGCRMGPFSQVRKTVIGAFDKLIASSKAPMSLMADAQSSAAQILASYATRVK